MPNWYHSGVPAEDLLKVLHTEFYNKLVSSQVWTLYIIHVLFFYCIFSQRSIPEWTLRVKRGKKSLLDHLEIFLLNRFWDMMRLLIGPLCNLVIYPSIKGLLFILLQHFQDPTWIAPSTPIYNKWQSLSPHGKETTIVMLREGKCLQMMFV